MASFAAIANRRGRAPSGKMNSLISIVSGSTCAILLLPNSQYHGVPLESMRRPYGLERGVGDCFEVIFPVFGSSLPMKFPDCTVNHRIPFGSNMGVCGSLAAGSGIGYSVTSPVFGFNFPMYALLLPVNQMLPS